MELFGVGPRVVAIFMIIMTILPLGAMPISQQIWIVYSVFWIIMIHYPYIIFDIVMFAFLWLIIPLYIFSILYIRQIVRYFYGKSSRDSALTCGLISLLFPTLVGIGTRVLLGFPYGSYLYVYPIPAQFLAGLVFLYKFREPENISPWSGQFIDWSWWIRLKAKWSNWGTDIIQIYFEEEDMIMNMSLSEVEEYYKASKTDE
ncbi:MAG: hypothetical protein ACFFCT_12900 [Candidatus Odinarchaeota archaeon]